MLTRIHAGWVLLLVMIWLLPATSRSEDAGPSTGTVASVAAAPKFRISAIAGIEEDYFAGVINEETGDSRLLRIGDSFYGYVIEKINPDRQEVMIAKGDQRFALFLRGDSTVVVSVSEDGEYAAAIEEPLEPEESTEVTTLEDFIRANYEAAGMTSPDDPIPEEYTKPVSKEEALKRMAESVGMEVPADAFKPVTREEFLKMHDPSNQPALNP